MDEEMITVRKQVYDNLVDDSMLLDFLRAAGVDNWDGWDYAMEMYHNAKGTEV